MLFVNDVIPVFGFVSILKAFLLYLCMYHVKVT